MFRRKLFYAKIKRQGVDYIVYSAVATNEKLTGGDRYNETSSGIDTAIQAAAFNMVKARIKKAGLIPPSTDDILAIAEDFYTTALKYQKGRLMGDLPTGAGASIATYDNVNKAIKLNIDLGNEQVDNYIASVGTNVQPGDVNGQIRSDAIFNDLKLHQGSIAEPADINGNSLANEQRG